MILFYFLSLSFSLTFGDVFQTALGKCKMEIYDGQINDIPELVEIIKKEADKLINELGPVNPQPFSIYITSNSTNFKNLAGSVPEWGIAVAKKYPNKIIMQSPSVAKISYSRFKKVLIHELNHIYMFYMPKYSTIPSWFKEGIAMYYSKEFSLLHKIEISYSSWENKLIPLNQLNNFNLHPDTKITLAYAESAASIEALIHYYGKNVLIRILDYLRNGKNFDLALENAIKEKKDDFQVKFDEFLKENYNWIFLLRVGKHFYIVLPFVLIFGFIYKKYKNKKILKLWKLEEELEDIQ